LGERGLIRLLRLRESPRLHQHVSPSHEPHVLARHPLNQPIHPRQRCFVIPLLQFDLQRRRFQRDHRAKLLLRLFENNQRLRQMRAIFCRQRARLFQIQFQRRTLHVPDARPVIIPCFHRTPQPRLQARARQICLGILGEFYQVPRCMFHARFKPTRREINGGAFPIDVRHVLQPLRLIQIRQRQIKFLR
jgi:hypothetical protein